MALEPEELAEIDSMLSAPNAGAQTFENLRQRFRHLAWTRCDASDLVEEPFRTYAAFDLHLLDGVNHCVQITADPERATGIVLARRESRG